MQSETLITYRNQEVKVVLEFPEQQEEKTEQEFIQRLKEVYLRKINNDTGLIPDNGEVSSLE